MISANDNALFDLLQKLSYEEKLIVLAALEQHLSEREKTVSLAP